ncbi:MAG: cation diffusion facilitator family transporter [Methanomassiliicoccaceae archaeon]|jgi:cation diffusion facilitator family transporter|nr:cation diffusion facilitator family transporter [Methanomassiliicoccaceae archaeon]
MSDGTSALARENYKFQKYIVAVSGIVLLTKFLAWLLSGSVALFTDALESLTNVSAGLIGLYALYLSAKPRDFDHPYGHGRAEFLSATVEGAMIVIAGAIIIIEGVRNILDPREIPNLELGMVLSFATVVLNIAVGTVAVIKGKRNRSQALVASGRHLQSDGYSTGGIIAGLVILFVLTSKGYEVLWLDGAIALIYGVIIIAAGVSVLRRSINSIMDKADMELLEKMVTTLSDNRREAWIDIHNLRIVKYGPVIHMDVHVTMPWDMPVEQTYREICKITELIKESYGDSVELSVSCDPCKEFSCPGCRRDCKERKADFVGLVKWDIENLSKDAQHGEVCDNADG